MISKSVTLLLSDWSVVSHDLSVVCDWLTSVLASCDWFTILSHDLAMFCDWLMVAKGRGLTSSTFDFWIWNAGATQAPHGHLSPYQIKDPSLELHFGQFSCKTQGCKQISYNIIFYCKFIIKCTHGTQKDNHTGTHEMPSFHKIMVYGIGTSYAFYK